MSPRPIKRSLLAKYCADDSRTDSYPALVSWNEHVTLRDYCDALSNISGELAMYLHLPFCALRCSHCSATAAVASGGREVDEYISRLKSELEFLQSVMGCKPTLRELHWGGGTPNFLADGQLVRVFDLIAERFTLPGDLECSLEADARLVTTTQLRWLRGLGFDRIRFGLHDLDPLVQFAIGRVQSIALITDAVERAREQGFCSLGLDLMFGLPHQTLERFRDTLDAVIELAPDRISCRGFQHQPAIRPHQRQLDSNALPDRNVRFSLYQLAVERFTEAGYVWIGADQFALPHDSLTHSTTTDHLHRDRENHASDQSRAIIGVGVSAMSEIGDVVVQNEPHLDGWQRALNNRRLPFGRGHRLSDDDRTRRRAIRALTTALSVQRDALPDDNEQTLGVFREFESDGLVTISDQAVNVTATGRYFLPQLTAALHATRRSSGGPASPRLLQIVS